MISYADLERIYRLERDSPTLQSLPQNFYSDAMELIEAPQSASHKDAMTGLLNETYERRMRKIMLHAFRSAKEKPPENITSREEPLFSRLVAILSEGREAVLRPSKPKFQSQTPLVNKTRVRILRPLPAIMASDLKEYGPFNGSEIVELPEDNAKILVSQGIAEEVN